MCTRHLNSRDVQNCDLIGLLFFKWDPCDKIWIMDPYIFCKMGPSFLTLVSSDLVSVPNLNSYQCNDVYYNAHTVSNLEKK